MRQRSWHLTLWVFLALCALASNDWFPAWASLSGGKPLEALSNRITQGGFRRSDVASSDPASRVTASLLAAADHFGYQWDDSITLEWQDITDGTQIAFSSPDDASSDPIAIGFNFSFYENTYTQLYVSTNGLITFGGGADSAFDQPLPLEIPPNDLIAPFWDDLEVSSGNVYYKVHNQGSPKSITIEWYRVVKLGGTEDWLTFEAVLYENGDILFQYLELKGNVETPTVGIEDGDGIDGLLYLHDAAGLVSGKAIRFTRPAPGARAKWLPGYQSAFAIYGQASFRFTLKNIGDLGADTFNLSASSSNPGWTVALYQADSHAPFVDTNSDGLIDTGSLPAGGAKDVLVEVRSPGLETAPGYTVITLTGTSSISPSRSFTATIQAALPAPFTQVYHDGESGLKLATIWSHGAHAVQASPYFTGNTMSITRKPAGDYLFAWEKNGVNLGYYSNIVFTEINQLGTLVQGETALTHNENLATGELTVNARYPSLASASDGKVGVLWEQYQFRPAGPDSYEDNSNVHFAILQGDNSLAYGPVSITNNTDWRGELNPTTPYFTSPAILALDNHRFVLAWIENRLQTDSTVSSLMYALYDTSGVEVTATTVFSQSDAGETSFIDPTLVKTDSGALIAYTVYSHASGNYSLAAGRINQDGQLIQAPTLIAGANGLGADSARFSDGKILLAWTNPTTDRIAVTILDSDGGTVLYTPSDLPRVDLRKPDYVSVTSDLAGHALLTWMDAEWNDYLYYAALDAQGELVTPPMIFTRGQGANPLIQTSVTGQGNAPYDGAWWLYLPLSAR